MTTEPDPRHARGLLTAAERLEMLFDEGGCEMAPPLDFADALWIGRGTVHGRRVLAAASDPDRHGGSLSGADLGTLARLADEGTAAQTGALVQILDGAAMRASLGVEALAGLDRVLGAQSRERGKPLRVGIVCGHAVGPQSLLPALDDLVAVSRAGARWSPSGPEPARALFDEDEEDEAYGGAAMHAETTGLAAIVGPDDSRTLLKVRATIGMLYPGKSGPVASAAAFSTVLPRDPLEAHDADELARLVADGRAFEDLWPDFASGLFVALAKVGGRPVGLLASRTRVAGGVLDARTARKATRFVSLATRLDIPLVGLIDCPGVLPGIAEDEAGALAELAAMRAALRDHAGPKAMLVLRRAFGVGALAFGLVDPATPPLRWPGARIALAPDDAGEGPGRLVEPAETRRTLIDILSTPARS